MIDLDANQVREVANLLLTQPGGRGAVRELCELIIRSIQSTNPALEVQCQAA